MEQMDANSQRWSNRDHYEIFSLTGDWLARVQLVQRSGTYVNRWKCE